MTHEELLSDITSLHFRGSRTPDVPYHALLAVALLHKPVMSKFGNEDDSYTKQCAECVPELYPCETIKAIEQELA
jgi:hypothetical protein